MNLSHSVPRLLKISLRLDFHVLVRFHDFLDEAFNNRNVVPGNQVDRNSKVFLDLLQFDPATLVMNERDRNSTTSIASGSTNAVEIGGEIRSVIDVARKIVIDHHRSSSDIDSPRENVCSYQDLQQNISIIPGLAEEFILCTGQT